MIPRYLPRCSSPTTTTPFWTLAFSALPLSAFSLRTFSIPGFFSLLRRLRLTLVLWLVVAFPLVSANCVSAAERPNVVLIMLDDLGFSDLGCYGASIIQTPTIDRLAADGLRFSQFYSTAKCHSSRICLLTGLYPYQAGDQAMSRGVTIGELLQAAGYRTLMTGKWHLDGEPTERGFDRYFGHLSGATNYFVGDNTFRLNGRPWSDFGSDFYTTDANTDFAMDFVEEAVDDAQPFLLYVAYNAPHYPLQARAEEARKYAGRFKSIGWDQLRQDRYARQLAMGLIRPSHSLAPRPDYIPAWMQLTDEWQQWEDDRMAAFAGMVDRVDQNIARLVNHLKHLGVWENTLLMLCSDNGACPFERTRGREFPAWDARSYWTYDVGWAHVGNTPFRWYKQNQHEGGIASPLIVSWPGQLRTTPGSITHQPGHLIDLLPTLADVAGAVYPTKYQGRQIQPVEGKSLLPILRGEQRVGHESLYFLYDDNRAIRHGDWKLVSAEWGRWELYNMTDDRTELNDLAAEQPERVERLRDLWFHAANTIDRVPKPRLLRPVKDTVPTFPTKQRSQYPLRSLNADRE